MFGFDAEAIEAIRAELGGGAGEEGVWPDNVAIVEAFLLVGTQFRCAALGGGMGPGRLVWLGLDYSGVRVGLDAAGVAVDPDLWAGLRVMERAAADALNGILG